MIVDELEKSYTAIAFLRRNWDNPLTPILLVVLAVLGGFVLAYHIDIFGVEAQISIGEGILIGAICLILLLIWFFSSRPRKTVRGKIGIVVAIGCESKDEEIKLHSDFVEALRDQIARTTRKYFDVYELSQYHTRQIHSHKEASNYLKLTRAHLIIFGKCKLRNHKGQLTYTVDFQEVIRHAPIPNEVQDELRRDMQLAFPTRMLIPQENELEGFEVTKDIFGIASQFTLGIASLLSGDPLTAFDLHQTAYREASDKLDVDDSSPEVLKRYKARLVKCLVLSGLHATQVYYRSKQHGYLDKMEHYLNVIQGIDPGNYDGHLIRAILLFIRDHDIEGARQEIKKAKNERNAAWQYSEAFLAAYEGKLEDAHKIYKRAFKGIVLEETPLDVEEFIVDVLATEKDKIQLWYCLGLINYFLKSDLQAAGKDFEEFVKAATKCGHFGPSIEFAKKYLSEIKDKIKLSKTTGTL